MRFIFNFHFARRVPTSLALTAAVSVPLMITTPAHAGTYKLYTCNVPGKLAAVASTAPWTARLDGVNTFFFNECAAGGAFGVGLNVKSMRAFGEASLLLERPATGPKSAIGVVRYRTWITAELAGTGAPAFVDQGGACGPPGCVTPDHEPWISAPYAQTNPSVTIRLRCTAGDCSFNSARPLQVRGVEADLYEDVPPSGEIEGGTLLAANVTPGQRTLSVSATDQESGVALVEVLLNDTVVASHNLESNATLCTHTEWNACPARYSTDLTIDTSKMPVGDYLVALRVTDAAGNRRVISGARPVSIGARRGATPLARLDASFARSRASYTTNFGKAARVRGRLTSAAGSPIVGAQIAVTERMDKPARRLSRASVTTGADGRFVYVASGRRPSRAVELKYAVAGAVIASRRLKLNVRATSTFKVSLRGVTVRYSGQVLSRPVPKAGKKLYIQGRAAGGAWQRFAVKRTDRSGRFAGRYRLRVRRPGVRLQFRVEIPKQLGYRFSPRTGPAVTRVVR